jgi:hypothetical protein
MGICLIVAAERKQASVILDYCEANFKQSPYLAQLVVNRIERTLRLNNGCEIEVRPSNYRTVRGITCVAAIADEICFWRNEDDSTNPDKAIIDAIRPSLATTKGQLFLISSPWARKGVMFNMYSRYFGKTDDPTILVANGPTKVFNSSLSQKVIDRAYERDPISAASEYGGEWRTDIESFLTREIVDSCVPQGRYELPFLEGVNYRAFCDPSGGINDSFALAIAHSEGDRVVLDLIRERKSPLNPDMVISEFAQTLRDYRISQVSGDRYGGQFPRERFATHGITYRVSDMSKSEYYQALLPILNSGRCELLDSTRLINQLCALERRTARGGRDSIDHPAGSRDDVANCVAAAIVTAAARPTYTPPAVVVPYIVGKHAGVISDPSGVHGPRPPAHYLAVNQQANERWRNFAEPFFTSPTQRWNY